MNLFKLPALKPLRAALHPLIEEQMKNYDTKAVVGDGKAKNKNRKKRKQDSGGAEYDLMKEQKRKLQALEEEYINQVSCRGCVAPPVDCTVP